MQDYTQVFAAEVAKYIARAEQLFGITMPEVTVLCNLRGRAAGVAERRSGKYSIRFNPKYIAMGGKSYEHMINDTVPHEVAHTVCQAFPRFGKNHDAGWQRVCKALGGTGNAKFTEDDAPEVVGYLRPWVYVTVEGNPIRVNKTIHNRIQQGVAFSVKIAGRANRLNNTCKFDYQGPVVTTAVKKPAPASVADTGKVTNASRVRARIAEAKAQGHSEIAVVEYAVNTLGMTRALAKAYVKNNWSKV